jgi:DNA-directed RNA polymerase specialized sigma24 family protein
VGFAVVAFRDRVLKPGRWSQQGGATLKTYFVGQVLIQFVPVFKAWLRTGRREVPVEEMPADRDRSALIDPEERAVASVEADRLLGLADGTTRAIILLRSRGYSQEEIAELLGLPSAKAVEARLYRFRSEHRGTA